MFDRIFRFIWPVSLLILLEGCEPKDHCDREGCDSQRETGVLDLIFIYAWEKEDWMEAVTTDFNQRALKDAGWQDHPRHVAAARLHRLPRRVDRWDDQGASDKSGIIGLYPEGQCAVAR